jgi:hypothetical protein
VARLHVRFPINYESLMPLQPGPETVTASCSRRREALRRLQPLHHQCDGWAGGTHCGEFAADVLLRIDTGWPDVRVERLRIDPAARAGPSGENYAATFSCPAPCGAPVCHPPRHVSQINNLRAKFDGSVIGVGSRITKIGQNQAGFCICWGSCPRKYNRLDITDLSRPPPSTTRPSLRGLIMAEILPFSGRCAQ